MYSINYFFFGAWVGLSRHARQTWGYEAISLYPKPLDSFLDLLCVCKCRWRILLFGETKGYLAWAKLSHDRANILLKKFISWPYLCFRKMLLCLIVKLESECTLWFVPRLRAWHHYCFPEQGFPILLAIDEGPRLCFLDWSSVHIWSVDSCCWCSTKNDRCVHIKCWLCSETCTLSLGFPTCHFQTCKSHLALPASAWYFKWSCRETKHSSQLWELEEGEISWQLQREKHSNSLKKQLLHIDSAGSTFLYYFNY